MTGRAVTQQNYHSVADLHKKRSLKLIEPGEYEKCQCIEFALVEIAAMANEGWEFINWTGYIEHVNDIDSEETTVSMPGQDISLKAFFKESDAVGPVSDIDGNVYNTVIIGDQEWMAENLRVTRNANGNNITSCCYNDDETNCELYGGLYTWHTVMNGQSSSSSNPSGVQGICPTGWHVPSDAQWTELVNFVENQGYPNSDVVNGVGNALKSCRQVGSPLGGDCDTSEHPRWNSDGTHHGFDEFGFSALPAGYRVYLNGTYEVIGVTGYFWSSTENTATMAFPRAIRSHRGNVHRDVMGVQEKWK